MRFALVILVALLPSIVKGATVVATDTTWQAVSNAIAATATGDLLIIPKGSNDWGAVTLQVAQNKRINISGLGMSNTTLAGTTRRILFHGHTTGTNRYGVHNLRFWGGASSVGLLTLGSSLAYPPTITNYNVMCRNVLFDGFTNRALYILGRSEGLVDGCIFRTYSSVAQQGLTFQGTQRDGNLLNCNKACLSYTNTVQFGTFTDFIYAERNDFDFWGDGDGALDFYNDAKAVVRRNTGRNSNYLATHEHALNRSMTVWEFYENVWEGFTNSVGFDSLSHLRSGVGHAFSNTLTTTYAMGGHPGPRVTQYRASGTNVFPCISTNCAAGASDCPLGNYYPCASVTGTNRMDGNMNVNTNEYGYPSFDQIGWADPTVATPTNLLQTFYGSYFKANTHNGTNVPVLVDNFAGNPSNAGLTGPDGTTIPNSADLIQEGRDYFDETMRPGFTIPGTHPLYSTASISPSSTSAAPLGVVNFSGVSGSGAYWYWFLDSNVSGGSIVQTNGVYTAGSTNGLDRVGMVDSWGNLSYADVSVSGAANPNILAPRIFKRLIQ